MKVSRIFIYPIKSARCVELRECKVEPRGLAGDRRWMVIDDEGAFVSQRDQARMALLQALLHEDGLTLRTEGLPDIEVRIPNGESRKTATVWRDTVEASATDPCVSDWLSQFLGFRAHLVHMDAEAIRPVNQDYGKAGDEVSFADGFPLLLANEASLGDLNHRIAAEVLPIHRFRPNVVVSGASAWAEDGWKRIRIGGVEFDNVKPCGRCLVTTTDQLTGERMGDEPLRTLATYRKVDTAVMFGVNLIPRGIGVIRVGDEVSLLD
jgi:uncharacterized protein YcbX